MVRIVKDGVFHKDCKQYEKMVHDMFAAMFKVTYPNENNTSLNKISGFRKLYIGFLKNIEEVEVDHKKLRRDFLVQKVQEYFARIAQERKNRSERFWAGYQAHEEVLRKCFKYMFHRKYPNYRQVDAGETFNDLLTVLEGQDIFNPQKFDPDRCRDKSISEEARFEQYIYTWIQSYLNRAYHERKKRSLMFRRISSVNDLHTGSFNVKAEIFDDEPFIQTDELPQEEKVKELKRLQDLHKEACLRHIPDGEYFDYGTLTEELDEQDAWKNVLLACRTEEEEAIVTLRKNGMSNEDIAVKLGMSSNNVSTRLDKVRTRLGRTLVAA